MDVLTAADSTDQQRRIAGGLLAGGLRAGDRIALQTTSSGLMLSGILGALRVGIVPVLLNAGLLDHERVADGRRQKATYLGPSFPDDEIQAYLDGEKIPYTKFASDDDLCERVAHLHGSAIRGVDGCRREMGSDGFRPLLQDQLLPGGRQPAAGDEPAQAREVQTKSG